MLKRRMLWIVFIVFIISAYVTPFVLFFNEAKDKHVSSAEIAAENTELEIDARIIATDLAKGSIQVQLIPSGGKLMVNGRFTTEAAIDIDTGAGFISRQFKPNVTIDPWTVTIIADEGDILTYPFDSYAFISDIQASSNGKPLQMKINLEHVLHGFIGRLALEAGKTGPAQLDITLTRSGSTLFVAILSTFSVLLVTVAVCIVAWNVVMSDRKFEFGMMVWSAALLFVIPSIRNALPGAIPIGALIDYAVFFWLQIAVGFAMCCLVYTWRRRI